MDKNLTKSLVFHGIIAVLLVASSWTIFSRREKIPDVKTVTVNLSKPMGDITNQKPAPKREIKPPAPKKPTPKPVEKKPEPKKPEPKKPEPKKPVPKPEIKKPEPKPQKKPEPAKTPEKKPEPKKETKKAEDSELESLLKDLDENKETATKTSDEEVTDEKSESDAPFDPNSPETVAEIDYITKLIVDQVKPCWSPPAGVMNAENLIVTVAIDIERDGSMKFVGFENESQYSSDPMYQAAADAARRAVLDPSCNPLREPPPADKYHLWREFGLKFNPRDLIY